MGANEGAMPTQFHDRRDAGRRLAQGLDRYRGAADLLVLALPRGGVEVGAEVARRLGAPLDVILVRKLGVPGHEELAMGAIASGGIRVLAQDVVDMLGISEQEIAAVAAAEEDELDRRERLYRGRRPPPEVRGKTVILVDDGLATGASMRAAAAVVAGQGPRRLVIAVPVAPPSTCAELRALGHEVVCGATPEPFHSVGEWYERFDQTSDDEVRRLLGVTAEGA